MVGKRGGSKRRMSSFSYNQMLQQRNPHILYGMRAQLLPGRFPAPVQIPGFSPRKFGFFNEAAPSVHPGHPGSEKRAYEGFQKSRLMMEDLSRIPGPRTMPPLFTSVEENILPQEIQPEIQVPIQIQEVNEPRTVVQEPAPVVEVREVTSTSMNELFAKMVWKKLDMIQDPVRLNRLHTEIMNILQQAIAFETANPK